jgi:hypothetical protein
MAGLYVAETQHVHEISWLSIFRHTLDPQRTSHCFQFELAAAADAAVPYAMEGDTRLRSKAV